MQCRLVAILVFSLSLGCGATEPDVSGAAPEQIEPAKFVPISGRYEVEGKTVAIESGYTRAISGTVILAADGDHYTATFDLTTTLPDPDGDEPLAAEVIGKGEGSVEGRTLTGIANTQIVAATVPNVDPSFAFIPRSVSTRIVSSSVTHISADGSVRIEIESQPEPGQMYTPTRTILSGMRISSAGVGGGTDLPD